MTATFDEAVNQSEGSETWKPVANQVSATIREMEGQSLCDAHEKPKTLTSKDILDAQVRDWIKRLLEIKQGKADKEERNVKLLLRDINKLEVGTIYWPKMEDDINHFMPNIHHEASMKTIASSAPLEFIDIDFLNVDSSCGGYQYLLVIPDHFTRFISSKPYHQKSTQRLQLIAGKMILSCDTASLKRI